MRIYRTAKAPGEGIGKGLSANVLSQVKNANYLSQQKGRKVIRGESSQRIMGKDQNRQEGAPRKIINSQSQTLGKKVPRKLHYWRYLARCQVTGRTRGTRGNSSYWEWWAHGSYPVPSHLSYPTEGHITWKQDQMNKWLEQRYSESKSGYNNIYLILF